VNDETDLCKAIAYLDDLAAPLSADAMWIALAPTVQRRFWR
jgi:hypothetical protein